MKKQTFRNKWFNAYDEKGEFLFQGKVLDCDRNFIVADIVDMILAAANVLGYSHQKIFTYAEAKNWKFYDSIDKLDEELNKIFSLMHFKKEVGG